MNKVKPNLSDSIIKYAILKYHEQHGMAPTPNSGDATPYFGYPETWKAVQIALNNGYRGLTGKSSIPKIAQALGISRRRAKPGTRYMSKKETNTIKNAIRKYVATNQGRRPIASGDATPYFGFRVTWFTVNRWLRDTGTNLKTIAESMRFKTSIDELTNQPIKPTWVSPKAIKQAMKLYFMEHKQWPTAHSGNATPYFGFRVTWAAVQSALYNGFHGLPGGSSLAKFRYANGLDSPKPPLTPELILEAVNKFRKVHGKNPSYIRGNATPYFGFPETWAAINAALFVGGRGMPGGSSLSKFCKDNPTQP